VAGKLFSPNQAGLSVIFVGREEGPREQTNIGALFALLVSGCASGGSEPAIFRRVAREQRDVFEGFMAQRGFLAQR
jgi:hypothetical protein